ncbi:MAG: iron-containing alcohol dehydrogenase [Chlorobium sp.]
MKLFWKDRYWCSTDDDVISELRSLFALSSFSNMVVIVDSVVAKAFPVLLSLAESGVRVFSFPGGEKAKSIESLQKLAQISQDYINPQSMFVVVGGGALIDTVGFLSGTLFRGLRYISVPTSTMSMIDSAYGGKTGINLLSKNQIGIYHHPEAVYVNPCFLKTLSVDHFLSGLIEALKLTFFDEDISILWKNISSTLPCWEMADIFELIKKTACYKLELFETDPFEEVKASLFLYGHPFANAFEVYSWENNNRYLPHGFAVGAGMVFSSWLASKVSTYIPSMYEHHVNLVSRVFDLAELVNNSCPPGRNQFAGLLKRDKYYQNSELRVPSLFCEPGYVSLELDAITEEYLKWRSTVFVG